MNFIISKICSTKNAVHAQALIAKQTDVSKRTCQSFTRSADHVLEFFCLTAFLLIETN